MSAWGGIVDVLLAVVVVGLAAWIDARGRGHLDDRTRQVSHRGYRVVTSLPLLLLVTFFLWPRCNPESAS